MDIKRVLLYAFCLLVLFLFYLWIRERVALRWWKKLEEHKNRRIFELEEMVNNLRNGRPMETVSGEIARTVNELQVENAALRGDVETSCQLIDKQRATITELTTRLNNLTNENRRFLGLMRAAKGRK